MTGADNTLGALSDRLTDSRDAFLRTLKTTLPREVWAIVGGVSLAAFVLLYVFTPQGLPNGDAALYAELIEATELGRITTHIGYYLLGIVVTYLSPLDPGHTLNLMSTLLAALSAGLAASIAYTLTGRRVAAVTAPAALLVLAVFLENATIAEVYVPQTFFFALCVQLVLWSRPVAAGLSFAIAFLITPSSVLALPFLVLLRPQGKFVIVWLTTALIAAAAAVVPNYQDFFFGGRGLLSGAAASQLQLTARLAKEGRELLGFSFVLVFALVGLVTVAMSRKHRLFTAALLTLWISQLAFGERFSDVPVQLPFYAMLAVMAGIGAARAVHFSSERWVSAAVVALFALAVAATAVPNYTRLADRSRQVDYFRGSVLAMKQAVTTDYLAVGSWSTGALLDYYFFGELRQEVWVNSEALRGVLGEDERLSAEESVTAALESGKQIWLLEPPGQGVYALFASYGYEIVPFESIFVANPITPGPS